MLGMSNDEIIAFNKKVIAEFRANNGELTGGLLAGNPTLLMTMTGAKSGRTLTSPLTYVPDGDAFLVMASNGGSPKLPGWGHNLRANPKVTLEVKDDTFDAVAVETEGDERRRCLDVMVSHISRFAGYQEAVERVIPLFRLQRA